MMNRLHRRLLAYWLGKWAHRLPYPVQCGLLTQGGSTDDDESQQAHHSAGGPQVLVHVVWHNDTGCAQLPLAQALPGHIVAVAASWECAHLEAAKQPAQLLLQLKDVPQCHSSQLPSLPSHLQLMGSIVDFMEAFAKLQLKFYRGPGTVDVAHARVIQRQQQPASNRSATSQHPQAPQPFSSAVPHVTVANLSAVHDSPRTDPGPVGEPIALHLP